MKRKIIATVLTLIGIVGLLMAMGSIDSSFLIQIVFNILGVALFAFACVSGGWLFGD